WKRRWLPCREPGASRRGPRGRQGEAERGPAYARDRGGRPAAGCPPRPSRPATRIRGNGGEASLSPGSGRARRVGCHPLVPELPPSSLTRRIRMNRPGVRVLRGPNVWAPCPMLEVVLDLNGTAADAAGVESAVRRLRAALPELGETEAGGDPALGLAWG